MDELGFKQEDLDFERDEIGSQQDYIDTTSTNFTNNNEHSKFISSLGSIGNALRGKSRKRTGSKRKRIGGKGKKVQSSNQINEANESNEDETQAIELKEPTKEQIQEATKGLS